MCLGRFKDNEASGLKALRRMLPFCHLLLLIETANVTKTAGLDAAAATGMPEEARNRENVAFAFFAPRKGFCFERQKT